MQTYTTATDNPLEAASSQMRNLCRDGEPLPRLLDQGSLGRILVHVNNISCSVSQTTRDHVNAAKRLNDFALIFRRVAKTSAPSDAPLAARLNSVSDNLRAASELLSRGGSIPWAGAAGHAVA